MATYYLDTNVLIGYSFLHNRWQDHTKRLMHSDNTLYIGETVFWEYLVKDGGPDREDVEIDWSYEYGNYEGEKRKLRKRKRFTYLELRSKDESELDPETVAETFIEEADVEEQIEHKFYNYFGKELDDNCSLDDAEDALNKLVNRVNSTAIDRKDTLQERLKVRKRRSGKDYSDIINQLKRIIEGDEDEECADAHVLCDAMDMKDRFIAGTVVTGDKGDMIDHKDPIENITHLNLVYLKNKFAHEDAEIPPERPD